MDPAIERALDADLVIDITTTGRKSGLPRRTEIWFHRFDGVVYITGTPGTRDWYANLLAHPEFTFHLKQSVKADLRARATPITDDAERRAVVERVVKKLERPASRVEEYLAGSPLVRVELEA